MDKDNKINPIHNKSRLAKDLVPDSPREWAAIGSAIARLGTMASGVTLFTADKYWTLGTMLITWAGHELHAYMKLHDESIQDEDK